MLHWISHGIDGRTTSKKLPLFAFIFHLSSMLTINLMRQVVLFYCTFFPFLLATGFQHLPRLHVTPAVVERTPWTLQSMAEEESVSDAEALLACWSYLKRRKRIGNWTNHERRKAIKEAIKESEEPSFFWEASDDNEVLMDGDEEYEEEEDEEDFDVPLDDLAIIDLEEKMGEEDDLNPDKWFGDFTSLPAEPSTTRLRRSQSAKKLWKDPDFRQRWQESRWGDKQSAEERQKKLVKSRVRQLPREFWGSDELASMTKEEINMAIETYVSGRKKRSASTKKALRERKEAFKSSSSDYNDERVARNSLFAMDHETLKEQQRLRSERAKARYETRLKNQQKKKGKPKPEKQSRKRAYLPKGLTPQDAILRIEAKLDENEYPTVNDLKIIMAPQKLGKRRDLLKQILLELFDLRGKCVPSDLNDEASDQLFVTTAPVQQLGDFVVHLLETRAKKE